MTFTAKDISIVIGAAVFIASIGAWVSRAETAHDEAQKAAQSAIVERAELRAATRVLQDAQLVRESQEGTTLGIRILPKGSHYCQDDFGVVTICSDKTEDRIQ